MNHSLSKKFRLTGLILFCLCTHLVHAQNWDINLLKSINQHPPTSSVWKGISATAEPLSVGIPAGMLLAGFISHDEKLKSRSVEILLSVTAAAIATEGLKIVVNRQRPYQKYPLDVFPYDASESGKSFPSAHTSLSFATATSLSLVYKKWYVTVPAFVWATSVGYSRLYLGEHYPSDVIAGAAVGVAGAYISHWLNKKLFPAKKKNP